MGQLFAHSFGFRRIGNGPLWSSLDSLVKFNTSLTNSILFAYSCIERLIRGEYKAMQWRVRVFFGAPDGPFQKRAPRAVHLLHHNYARPPAGPREALQT